MVPNDQLEFDANRKNCESKFFKILIDTCIGLDFVRVLTSLYLKIFGSFSSHSSLENLADSPNIWIEIINLYASEELWEIGYL